MTLPTSYDRENENKNFLSQLISVKYFNNYFKKDRILMLVMTICFFIFSPLVSFFIYTYSSSGTNYSPIASYNRVVYCIIAVACGIILPLYLYNYNHSRKSSIFFNSLPIKKHTLYNTHALLGIVYFLISVTINFLLASLLLILSNPTVEIVVYHLSSYGINFVIFLAIYCTMIFAANIAGTTISSVILYVYINFYLACWIFIPYIVFEMLCRYTTFIMTSEMFFNTSFIMYTVSKMHHPTVLQTLLILAISAVFYICGFLLNKRHRIEKAEHSIYFERFEQIFKYSMLAVVIIIGGTAFYQVGSGFGYYIGSLFSGVIGLIVMNLITRKNIKESFYKFRNFIIFFLALTILSIPTVFVLNFLDTFVPKPDSIKYVEHNWSTSENLYSFNYYGNFYKWTEKTGQGILSNNRNPQLKEKAAIEAINDMQTLKYNANNLGTSEYQVGDIGRFSSYRGNFDYKFNNGYRLSKRYFLYYSSMYEFLSSSEYKDAYYRLNASQDYINSTFYPIFNDQMMDTVYNKASGFNVSVWNLYASTEYSSQDHIINAEVMTKLIDAIKKDIVNISADKQKFMTVYDGLLENNKYLTNTPEAEVYDKYARGSLSPESVREDDFPEYRLELRFSDNDPDYHNSEINIQIVINHHFTETLRCIDEYLK